MSFPKSSGRQVEPIEPRRGAAEQIRFLGRTCRTRQNLAGTPERRVAIGALVDGEVALEHAAPGAESFDAGLEIRPPGMRQGFGGKRPWLLVKIEPADPHPEPAELHADVLTTGERPDGGGPAREHFRPLRRIGSDSERAADVVEHDRRVRKRLRERRELVDLRMIEPGIEAKPERRKTREPLAKAAVGKQTRRRPVARVHDGRVGVPGTDVANAPEAAAPR